VQLLQKLGRSDEALALAADGLRVAPKAGAPQMVYGMALAGHGRWQNALQHLRAGQELFDGDPAEQRRVDALVAVMRAKAPDSLRALFLADSVAAVARQAQRDSAMAHGKHKQP